MSEEIVLPVFMTTESRCRTVKRQVSISSFDEAILGRLVTLKVEIMVKEGYEPGKANDEHYEWIYIVNDDKVVEHSSLFLPLSLT